MTFATAVHILSTSFVYRTNVYWSVIHGIKRKPHLSVVWNWYHFVAIANLHQPRPTDSADINTWLQLSDTSSIPPMHGGFLLLPTFCLLFSLQLIYYQTAFYTSNLNRIVVLQKKVIRIICRMKPRDSCESKYSELCMMRFLDINVYMISKFMFHVCKSEVPSIFGTYFQANWQCNYFSSSSS